MRAEGQGVAMGAAAGVCARCVDGKNFHFESFSKVAVRPDKSSK